MSNVMEHMERAIRYLNRDRDGKANDPYAAKLEIENALHHYKVEIESIEEIEEEK